MTIPATQTREPLAEHTGPQPYRLGEWIVCGDVAVAFAAELAADGGMGAVETGWLRLDIAVERAAAAANHIVVAGLPELASADGRVWVRPAGWSYPTQVEDVVSPEQMSTFLTGTASMVRDVVAVGESFPGQLDALADVTTAEVCRAAAD